MESIGGGEEYLEEVPALLVVVLGLSICILSIVNAHIAYADNSENLRCQELCGHFASSVGAYEQLTWNENSMIFDPTCM